MLKDCEKEKLQNREMSATLGLELLFCLIIPMLRCLASSKKKDKHFQSPLLTKITAINLNARMDSDPFSRFIGRYNILSIDFVHSFFEYSLRINRNVHTLILIFDAMLPGVSAIN